MQPGLGDSDRHAAKSSGPRLTQDGGAPLYPPCRVGFIIN